MTQPVNKQAVAAAFGRAAPCYDRFAIFQRIAGERLRDKLDNDRLPRRVLDAGCGTGWFSRYWRRQGSEVTALDLSSAMLAQVRNDGAAHHIVQGDIEAIPLPDSHFDLAWSNLAVQWCSRLPRALAELYRTIRPGGTVAFSTLTYGSLHELDMAWQAVDSHLHTNRFLYADDIAQACPTGHRTLCSETVTLHFPDALSAMRSLKGIGATHLHTGRESGVLTRAKLMTLEAAWPRDESGLILTYHLLLGVLHRE